MKNYYKILEISRSAGSVAIRKAYRDLAKLYHPDVNNQKDAQEKFVEINEAFQVLINIKRRRQYDQLYDQQILNKEPKKKKRYNNKHERWEDRVNNAAYRGTQRGKRYASKKSEKVKYPTRWFDFLGDILVEFIFELIFSIFE